MTRLLITGGLGFLGLEAAKNFLRRGLSWSPTMGCPRELTRITLFDYDFPDAPLPEEVTSDERVQVQTGDFSDPAIAAELVHDEDHEPGDLSIIHLASMVSGNTEADPVHGWAINVDGTRNLLNACAEQAPGARFLFASSTATFGPVGADDPPSSDSTKQLPQNTYGMHKVICEMMLNDYSRRGHVDARGLRLPVIVVRPGGPNAALTTCWSSVVREPLAGSPCTLPVPADRPLPVASYGAAVRGMAHMLLKVSASDLGADRTTQLPALSLSPRQLYDAAANLAKEASARGGGPPLPFGQLIEAPQDVAVRVAGGMGATVDAARGLALGLSADASAESIVEDYARDYAPSVHLPSLVDSRPKP